MIQRRALLNGIFATGALTLGGCGRTTKTNYRMSIEVTTPHGLCSGSSVREVANHAPFELPFPSIAEDRPSWRVRGEAVMVDLPDGQVLFGLLSSGDGVRDYASREIWFIRRELNRDSFVLWPDPPRTTRPVIFDPLPMLVRFRDIADPTTVEKVDPNDLAASFGVGVKLRQITVKMTNDVVTAGIEKRLEWLSNVRGSLVHIPVSKYPPSGTELPLYVTLTELDFIEGAI